MNDIIKANLYVDSNYSYYIHNHLLAGIEGYHCSIDWANLKKYVELFIFSKENIRCVINKSSYFVGIGAPTDTSRNDFYTNMECAGIERKSFPLKLTTTDNLRLGLKEDAIDTTLVFTAAKDFYSVPKEDRFDYIVLIAGDSDFVPLIDGLRSEGIKSIVMYYDFSDERNTTRASQILLDKADYVISIESLLKDRVDENAKAIFKKTENRPPNIIPPQNNRLNTEQSMAFIPVSFETMKQAMSMCRQDDEGYVLVARLGVMIEQITNRKIPANIKLKDIIEAYSDRLETLPLPAFRVRLRRC